MSCQIMSNAIYEKSRIGMRDIKKFLAAIYRGSSYAADLRSQSNINLELERPEREKLNHAGEGSSFILPETRYDQSEGINNMGE